MKVRWSKISLCLTALHLAATAVQMPGAYADNPDPLKGLFELRHRLIAMTNQDAVIAVEIQLAFD